MLACLAALSGENNALYLYFFYLVLVTFNNGLLYLLMVKKIFYMSRTSRLVLSRKFLLVVMLAILLTQSFLVITPRVLAAKPIVNDPIPQRRTLEVGGSTSISITAADPDNDPLDYAWSAVSGKISGTGRTATYESPGIVPVANVDTVTVTVSDGENTVSKSVTIRIEAPSTPTKLYFAPNSGNIQIGAHPKEIKVFLDAEHISVSQIDLDILYNSAVLELVDQNPSVPGTQILASPQVKEILRNEVAPTSASANHIIFSAKYQNLKGRQLHVATLYFNALKEQDHTPLKFQFLKFATNDTNVIKSETSGVDALEEVQDAEFKLHIATKPFVGAAPTTQAPAGSTPSPSTQQQTTNLLDTGPSDVILAGIAFFLFVIYLLFKACAPKRT